MIESHRILPRDDTQLRDAWIAMHRPNLPAAQRDALFWAWERVRALSIADPQEALAFVLALLMQDCSIRHSRISPLGHLKTFWLITLKL